MYNRAYVISAGCAIWAVFTAAFSVCTSIDQGMMVWAFNGLGLAWMIPNGQSLIADLYDNEHRGTAFGALLCTGAQHSSAPWLHRAWSISSHLGPRSADAEASSYTTHTSPTSSSAPHHRPLLQALWVACWAACTRQTSQGSAYWGWRGGGLPSSPWRVSAGAWHWRSHFSWTTPAAPSAASECPATS
jgi:MFS family permease